MSTVSEELDAWTAQLAVDTGYPATRDPDLIHPPCLFVALPASVTAPLDQMVLTLPVHIVGATSGKQQGDYLLDMLPAVLAATGQQTAELDSVTSGDITWPTYLVNVMVRSDPATPPAPVTVPSAPGEPVASNWIEVGGGWQYDITWAAVADDGGSPLETYRVVQNGAITTVNGNTLTLGSQFSLTFPVSCDVTATNEFGAGPASPTASFTPPV